MYDCPEGTMQVFNKDTGEFECLPYVELGTGYEGGTLAFIGRALAELFNVLLMPLEWLGRGTAKVVSTVAGSFWDTLSARGKASLMIVVLAVLLVYFGPLIGRAIPRVAK